MVSFQMANAPSHRRYAFAVQMVLDDPDCSISEAARLAGVSRPRLSERVKEARAKQEELNRRSLEAKSERAGVKQLEVSGETRRVPPIGEFVRRYFDGQKCFDCEVHHEVPFFHDEIMTKMTDPAVKRLLVNVPPGHSKSTNGTVFTTVYELCRDPNLQTAIISKSQKMASRFVRQIATLMTRPELYADSTANLIEEWGPFADAKGNLGNMTEFYVAGRMSMEKDPSVQALGIDSHLYGNRLHRIICDDIADLENQRNPVRVEEMMQKLMSEADSRVGRYGKLMFIGTRVMGGDIYSILQDLPAYEVIRYPVIMDEDAELTLWPDHFAFKDAVQRRQSMSAEHFDLIYMNTSLPSIGASFKMEHIERCLDEDRHVGDYPENCALILGIDPAGANAQAGFTSMVLWAVDQATGRRYLVDIANHKQMKAPQVFAQIKDYASSYPLREVRVETNGLAAQLFQYNTELNAFLANKGVRLSPHVTARNKWDPQFGVEAMAVHYHNGNVSLPWADKVSQNKVQPFIDQLIRFPMGKPDDIVMAAWVGELGCKDAIQRSGFPLFDPRATAKLPGRLRRNRKVISFGNGVRAPTLDEEMGYTSQGGGRVPGRTRYVNVEGEVPRERHGVLTY